MAVINDYVMTNVAAGKLETAAFVNGGDQVGAVVTFEIAAADEDGSIYRLLKNISPDLIPLDIMIFNDAITGGTDFDLGFYAPLSAGGAVYDKDNLVDGANLSSGHASGSELDGMSNVDLANRQKRIYELAGHTLATKKTGYDIALTANTVGSGAGTVTVVFLFIQG